MTRRARRQDGNTETQVPESATPETEATAEVPDTEETAVTEATVSTEAPAAESTETPKPEADLSAFEAAVQAAAAEADTDTGTVPEAQIANVTAEYRKLDGIKAKNKAKNFVNEQMKSAMAGDNLPGARAYLQLSDEALVAGSKAASEREPKVPVDPTEAAVQRIGTLQLALELAPSTFPEGVSEDYMDKVSEFVTENREAVQSLLTWTLSDAEDKGEEPEVSAVAKQAAKLALGKSARAGGKVRTSTASYTGERRDIGVHIVNAFADKEEGTFMTIAEIRNVPSDEYGDSQPSAGAISARLFPKDTDGNPTTSSMLKFGIRPDTNEVGRKGAVKDSSVIPEESDDEE